jgi:hypothetical protein
MKSSLQIKHQGSDQRTNSCPRLIEGFIESEHPTMAELVSRIGDQSLY